MTRLFRAAALAAVLSFSALAGPYAFKPTVSVSVGTSATALATNTFHVFAMLCNTDSSKTLSWSFDSAVTTSTGMPLKPGDCITFDNLGGGQLLYGVTTSGTLDARVAEGFAR